MNTNARLRSEAAAMAHGPTVPPPTGRITTDYLRGLVDDPSTLSGIHPADADCPAHNMADAAIAAYRGVDNDANGGDRAARATVDLVQAYAEGQIEEQVIGLETRTRPMGDSGNCAGDGGAARRCADANKAAHELALGPAFCDLPQLSWLNVCALHAHACKDSMREPKHRQPAAMMTTPPEDAGGDGGLRRLDVDGTDDDDDVPTPGAGADADAGPPEEEEENEHDEADESVTGQHRSGPELPKVFVPGELRVSNVRIGQRKCVDHTLVKDRLAEFLLAFRNFEQRLPDGAVSACAKAAALILGINEIHAFADGNGRLARLLANWALRRGGVPFSVVLCPSPHYRARYVETLRAAMLDPSGHFKSMVAFVAEVTWNAWQYVVVAADGFQARVASAPPPPWADPASSFRGPGGTGNAMSNQMPTAPAAAGAARAAAAAATTHRDPNDDGPAPPRREMAGQQQRKRSTSGRRPSPRRPDAATLLKEARNEARASQCIVCLDDGPAVAMLCCGAPAHIECMAQWMLRSDHTNGDVGTATCPQCRDLVPRRAAEADDRDEDQQAAGASRRIPGTLARLFGDIGVALEDLSDGDDDGAGGWNEDDEEEEEDEEAAYTSGSDDADDEDEWETDESVAFDSALCPLCQTRQWARACSNDLCATCCVEHGHHTCARHSVNGVDVPEAALCSECFSRNKAAACSNDMCGSCCKDSGSLNCVRHDVDWRSEDAESDDDGDSSVAVAAPTSVGVCPCCLRQSAMTCTNAMCKGCCGINGTRNCARHEVDWHGDGDDEFCDDSSESTEPTPADNACRGGCPRGRQRAVMCTNRMCSSCCRERGKRNCVRHDNWGRDTPSELSTGEAMCLECNEPADLGCEKGMCLACCKETWAYCMFHDGME